MTPPTPQDAATTPLRFGYGTNGLADLRLDDALPLLADLGYDGVGLTLDHMHLDPLAPDLAARTRRVAHRLDTLGLGVTIETGARYVLDPRRKHGPSLLDHDPDDRARRIDLLLTAVRVATDLGAHAVHCFSGVTPAGTSTRAAWQRLTAALDPVVEAATAAGVPLAVEPEPGHLLATLADFHHLCRALGGPEALGLTLDIGHCQCLEPLPPADCVRAAGPWLRHVQIEDMRRGVHEHLPFGTGEIDVPPVLAALAATGYQGLTVVELPRHSHAGPHFAAHSLPFLHQAAAAAGVPVTRAHTGAEAPAPRHPAAPETHVTRTPTAAEIPAGRTRAAADLPTGSAPYVAEVSTGSAASVAEVSTGSARAVADLSTGSAPAATEVSAGRTLAAPEVPAEPAPATAETPVAPAPTRAHSARTPTATDLPAPAAPPPGVPSAIPRGSTP